MSFTDNWYLFRYSTKNVPDIDYFDNGFFGQGFISGFLLIIGEKEVADGVVSVRRRKEGDKGSMKVADFLKMTEDDRKVVR